MHPSNEKRLTPGTPAYDHHIMAAQEWNNGWSSALKHLKLVLIEARQKINDQESLKVLDEVQDTIKHLEMNDSKFQPAEIVEYKTPIE